MSFQTDTGAYEPPYGDMVDDHSFPIAGIVIIVVIAIIVLASIVSSAYLIMTSFRVQRRNRWAMFSAFGSRFDICGSGMANGNGGLPSPQAQLPTYEDALRMGASVPPKCDAPSRPPSYGRDLDQVESGISAMATINPLRIIVEDEDQQQEHDDHRTTPELAEPRNEELSKSCPVPNQPSTSRVAEQLSARLHNLLRTSPSRQDPQMEDVPL